MNGWLIIDKPSGITSTQVGSALKRLFNVRKVGHLGTLDPLASGLLVMAIGEATKLIPYVEKNISIFGDSCRPKKEYEFDILFGSATDTYDAHGIVTGVCEHLPTKKEIYDACAAMLGDQYQIPPVYSAIKLNGKRLCDLARKGQNITPSARKITVFSLEYIGQSCETICKSKFLATVSSGTYIRSLANDIANKANTLGYITYLRRIKDGSFDIDQAISLEKLSDLSHKGSIRSFVFPIGAFLGDIPVVTVSEDEWSRLAVGRSVNLPDNASSTAVQIFLKDVLVGMGYVLDGVCYPRRILSHDGGV
ncbi:MAG: tRNA pseudouridine(55) synthase TruB [Holosporales bacterium]|jgi:tRNA pseudouridine55 synthase|nr:tRNA pseudouridine(55) synthase TruB [Holosporales bacterium]